MFCSQNAFASRSVDPRDEPQKTQSRSGTAWMKVISKQDLLQPYLDNEFSDVQSSRMAQYIERYIKAVRKFHRETPYFVEAILNRLYLLHNYNVKVAQVTSEYPLTSNLTQLLLRYIVLESNVLYKKLLHTPKYEKKVEERIFKILHHIYNAYLETLNIPPEKLFKESCKAILQLIIRVKTEFEIQNDLMENMAKKLLIKMGRLEEVNLLQKKCMSKSVDACLRDPEFVQSYKNIITSDYGTDDDLRIEEKSQTNVEREKNHKMGQDDDIFVLDEESKTSSKCERRQRLEEKRQLLSTKHHNIFSHHNTDFEFRKPSLKVFELDSDDESESNNEKSPALDDIIIIDDEDDKPSIKVDQELNEDILELSSDEDDNSLIFIPNEKEGILLKIEDTEEIKTSVNSMLTCDGDNTINNSKETVHNNVMPNMNSLEIVISNISPIDAEICTDKRQHENKNNSLLQTELQPAEKYSNNLEVQCSRTIENISDMNKLVTNETNKVTNKEIAQSDMSPETETVNPINIDLKLKSNFLPQHENNTSLKVKNLKDTDDKPTTPESVYVQKESLEKCVTEIKEPAVSDTNVNNLLPHSDQDTLLNARNLRDANTDPVIRHTNQENQETMTSEKCIQKSKGSGSNSGNVQELKNSSDVVELIEEVNTAIIVKDDQSGTSVADTDNLVLTNADFELKGKYNGNENSSAKCHTKVRDSVIVRDTSVVDKLNDSNTATAKEIPFRKNLEFKTDLLLHSDKNVPLKEETQSETLSESIDKHANQENLEEKSDLCQDHNIVQNDESPLEEPIQRQSNEDSVNIHRNQENLEGSMLKPSLEKSNEEESNLEVQDHKIVDKECGKDSGIKRTDSIGTQEESLDKYNVNDDNSEESNRNIEVQNSMIVIETQVVDQFTNDSNTATAKEIPSNKNLEIKNDLLLYSDENVLLKGETQSETHTQSVDKYANQENQDEKSDLYQDHDIVENDESPLKEPIQRQSNEDSVNIHRNQENLEESMLEPSVEKSNEEENNLEVQDHKTVDKECGKHSGIKSTDSICTQEESLDKYNVNEDNSEESNRNIKNDLLLYSDENVLLKGETRSEIHTKSVDKYANQENQDEKSDLYQDHDIVENDESSLKEPIQRQSNEDSVNIHRNQENFEESILEPSVEKSNEEESSLEVQDHEVVDKECGKDSGMKRTDSIGTQEESLEKYNGNKDNSGESNRNITVRNSMIVIDTQVVDQFTNDSNTATAKEIPSNNLEIKNDFLLYSYANVLLKEETLSETHTESVDKYANQEEKSDLCQDHDIVENDESPLKEPIQRQSNEDSVNIHRNQENLKESKLKPSLEKCNEEERNLEVQNHKVVEKECGVDCGIKHTAAEEESLEEYNGNEDNSGESNINIKVQNSMVVIDASVVHKFANDSNIETTNLERELKNNLLHDSVEETSLNVKNETETDSFNIIANGENVETEMLEQSQDNSNEKENDQEKVDFAALDELVTHKSNVVSINGIVQADNFTSNAETLVRANTEVEIRSTLVSHSEEQSDTDVFDGHTIEGNTESQSLKESIEKHSEQENNSDKTNFEGSAMIEGIPFQNKLKTNQNNPQKNSHKTLELCIEIIKLNIDPSKNNLLFEEVINEDTTNSELIKKEDNLNDDEEILTTKYEIKSFDTCDKDKTVALSVSEVEIALPESIDITSLHQSAKYENVNSEDVELLPQTTMDNLLIPCNTDKNPDSSPAKISDVECNSESTQDMDSAESSVEISILNLAQDNMTVGDEINEISHEGESSRESGKYSMIIAGQDKGHIMSTFDSMVKNQSSIHQEVGNQSNEEKYVKETIVKGMLTQYDLINTYETEILNIRQNVDLDVGELVEIVAQSTVDEIDDQNEHVIDSEQNTTCKEAVISNTFHRQFTSKKTYVDTVSEDNKITKEWDDNTDDSNQLQITKQRPEELPTENICQISKFHDIEKSAAVSKFSHEILKTSLEKIETVTTIPNGTVLSQQIVQLDISDNENTGLNILATLALDASRQDVEVEIKKKKVSNRRKLTERKKQKKPIIPKRSQLKLITSDVTENKRITRSAQIKSIPYSDSKCKPHDFVINSNSVVPASNNIYTQKLSEVHLTSEDSNDSEGILLIDEEIDNKNGKLSKEECYNEDTLNENIVFNFEPKVKGTVLLSIPDTYQENFDLLAQIEQLDKYSNDRGDKTQNLQNDKISSSVGTDSYLQGLEGDKISTESKSENKKSDIYNVQHLEQSEVKKVHKPFRTKAEQKDYDKFSLKPYVNIERLNISFEGRKGKYEKVRSQSFDLSMIRTVYDEQLLNKKNTRPLESDDLKNKPGDVASPELEEVTSQQTNSTPEENNSTRIKPKNCDQNENKDSDDDLPLSERTQLDPKQTHKSSSTAKQKSSHGDLKIEHEEKSKHIAKTKTKNNHTNKDRQSFKKKLIIMDDNHPAAVSSTSPPLTVLCFNKSVPSVPKNVSFETEAENLIKINEKECTTEVKMNIQIKDKIKDKRYYTHPKLRRKSMLENDAATEDSKGHHNVPISTSNIKILSKCKNTILPTTEKLKKILQTEFKFNCIETSLTENVPDNSVNHLQEIKESNYIYMSTLEKFNEPSTNFPEQNVCTKMNTEELETVKETKLHLPDLKLNMDIKPDKSEINEALVTEAEVIIPSSIQEPSTFSLKPSDISSTNDESSISDQTVLPNLLRDAIHNDLSITETEIITPDILNSNEGSINDIFVENEDDNLDNLPLSERSTLSHDESIIEDKVQVDKKQIKLKNCSEMKNSNVSNQTQNTGTEENALGINTDENVNSVPRKMMKSQTKLIRKHPRNKWTKSKVKSKTSKINKSYNRSKHKIYNNQSKSSDDIMLTDGCKKYVKNNNKNLRRNKMKSSEKLTKPVNKPDKNSIINHLSNETTYLKENTGLKICKNKKNITMQLKLNSGKKELINKDIKREVKGNLQKNHIQDKQCDNLLKPDPLKHKDDKTSISSTNKQLKKSNTIELTIIKQSKEKTTITEDSSKEQNVSNQNTIINGDDNRTLETTAENSIVKIKDEVKNICDNSQLESANLKSDMESHDHPLPIKADISGILEPIDSDITSEANDVLTVSYIDNIIDIESQSDKKEVPCFDTLIKNVSETSETVQIESTGTTNSKKIEVSVKPNMEHNNIKVCDISMTPIDNLNNKSDSQKTEMSLQKLNIVESESDQQKVILKQVKETEKCDILTTSVLFEHNCEKSTLVSHMLIKDVDSEGVWQEKSAKQDINTNSCGITITSSNLFSLNCEKSTDATDIATRDVESEKDHQRENENQNKGVVLMLDVGSEKSTELNDITKDRDEISQNQSNLVSHDMKKPLEVNDVLAAHVEKKLCDENQKLPGQNPCDSSISCSKLLEYSWNETTEIKNGSRVVETENDQNLNLSVTSSHLCDENFEKSRKANNTLIREDLKSENTQAKRNLKQEKDIKNSDMATTSSNLDNSLQNENLKLDKSENYKNSTSVNNISSKGEYENTSKEPNIKLPDTKQNFEISITVSEESKKSTEIDNMSIRDVKPENHQKETNPKQGNVQDISQGYVELKNGVLKEVSSKQDSVTSTVSYNFCESKSEKSLKVEAENHEHKENSKQNKNTKNLGDKSTEENQTESISGHCEDPKFNNQVKSIVKKNITSEGIGSIFKGMKKMSLEKHTENEKQIISEQKNDSQSKSQLVTSKTHSNKKITNLENNTIDIKLKNIEDAFRKYMPGETENKETTNRKRKLSEINVDVSSASDIQSTSDKSPKLPVLSTSPRKRERKDIECIINQLKEDKEKNKAVSSEDFLKSQLSLEPLTVNVDVCTLKKKLLQKIKGCSLELQEDSDVIGPVAKNSNVRTKISTDKSDTVQTIDEVSSISTIKDYSKLETNKKNIQEMQNISIQLDTTYEKGSILETPLQDFKKNIPENEVNPEKSEVFKKSSVESMTTKLTAKIIEYSNPELSDVQTTVCESLSRKDKDSGTNESTINSTCVSMAGVKFTGSQKINEVCGDKNEEGMSGLEDVVAMPCINKENLEIINPSSVIFPESVTFTSKIKCNAESSLSSTPTQDSGKNLEETNSANSFNMPKETFPLEIPSKKTSSMNPCVEDLYATNMDETNLVNLYDLILNGDNEITEETVSSETVCILSDIISTSICSENNKLPCVSSANAINLSTFLRSTQANIKEQFIPMSEVDSPKNIFDENCENGKVPSNKARNCLFSLNNEINNTNPGTLTSSSISLNLQEDHFIKIPMSSNQTFDLISSDTIIQNANRNHFMDEIPVDNENNDISEARSSNTIDHNYTLESPGGPLLSERSEEDQMFPITFDRNLVDSPGEFPLNDNQLPSELGESDETYKLNIHNDFAVKSLVMLGGQKVEVNPFPLPNSLFSEDSISNSEESSNSLDTTSLVNSIGQQTQDIPNDTNPWTQYISNENVVAQSDHCHTSFSLSQNGTVAPDSGFNEDTLLKVSPGKQINHVEGSPVIPNDTNSWTQFIENDNPNEVIVVSQNDIQANLPANSSFYERTLMTDSSDNILVNNSTSLPSNFITEEARKDANPWTEKVAIDSSFSIAQIDVQTTALNEKPTSSDTNPWTQFIANGNSHQKVVVIPNEQYIPLSISQNNFIQYTSFATPNIDNKEELLNKQPEREKENPKVSNNLAALKPGSSSNNSKKSTETTQKNTVRNDDFPPKRKYSRTVVAPPKKEANMGTGKSNIKSKVQNKAEENVEHNTVGVMGENSLPNINLLTSLEMCKSDVKDNSKINSSSSSPKTITEPSIITKPLQNSSDVATMSKNLIDTDAKSGMALKLVEPVVKKCQNEKVPAKTPNLKNETVENVTKTSDVPVKKLDITFNSAELVKSQKRAAAIKCTNYSCASPTRETKSAKNKKTQRSSSRSKTSTPEAKPNHDIDEKHKSKGPNSPTSTLSDKSAQVDILKPSFEKGSKALETDRKCVNRKDLEESSNKSPVSTEIKSKHQSTTAVPEPCQSNTSKYNYSIDSILSKEPKSSSRCLNENVGKDCRTLRCQGLKRTLSEVEDEIKKKQMKPDCSVLTNTRNEKITKTGISNLSRSEDIDTTFDNLLQQGNVNKLIYLRVTEDNKLKTETKHSPSLKTSYEQNAIEKNLTPGQEQNNLKTGMEYGGLIKPNLSEIDKSGNHKNSPIAKNGKYTREQVDHKYARSSYPSTNTEATLDHLHKQKTANELLVLRETEVSRLHTRKKKKRSSYSRRKEQMEINKEIERRANMSLKLHAKQMRAERSSPSNSKGKEQARSSSHAVYRQRVKSSRSRSREEARVDPYDKSYILHGYFRNQQGRDRNSYSDYNRKREAYYYSDRVRGREDHHPGYTREGHHTEHPRMAEQHSGSSRTSTASHTGRSSNVSETYYNSDTSTPQAETQPTHSASGHSRGPYMKRSTTLSEEKQKELLNRPRETIYFEIDNRRLSKNTNEDDYSWREKLNKFFESGDYIPHTTNPPNYCK